MDRNKDIAFALAIGGRILRLALVVALIGTTAACLARRETRGNQPDPDRVAELRPGELGKKEVREILGTPSNVTSFGQETWYYVTETSETFAFLKPEVISRQVLVLKFDDRGLLAEMSTIDEKEGREIEMVERRTPTTGHKIGFFEQIFGNFGRIGG